jgi:hypothetical protein
MDVTGKVAGASSCAIFSPLGAELCHAVGLADVVAGRRCLVSPEDQWFSRGTSEALVLTGDPGSYTPV